MSTSPTGGAQARRALVRWALRLFRREWRQQVLVLALLTVSVAAAIGFATAAYNTVGVSEDATLGSARQRIDADAPPAGSLPAVVAAAEARFGTVDVFVRWSRPVPGSVESVEFRAQDPDGAFSGPMLALRDGRHPGNADEVALTDAVADQFGLRVGDAFDLDGRDRTVVGMVENPSDLGSEFALVSAASRDQPDELTILLGGSGGADEEQAVQDFGTQHLGEGLTFTARDSGGENVVAAAAVLGTTIVALMLVSLIAAAGFVVLAQRRLRQLGMLEAIGATERHVRLVMVANGAVLGMAAALTGAGIGLAAWVAAAPRMEAGVGHRIDRWNVPWWVVTAAMALVVVSAIVAAWWPARAVARVPTTAALSGRPPRPRPVHHSAELAGVLIAVGVVSLVIGEQRNDLLVVTGTAATVAGMLLVSPLAIRLAARAVDGLRVGVRLPLRDLARHQARSGTALAAVSLSLGIPVAIVVTATSTESTRPLGNLSDRQLLIWTRDPNQPEGVSPYYTEDPHDEGFSPYLPRLSAADLDDLAGQAQRIASTLDEATVAGLELVTDPAGGPTPEGRLAVMLARPVDTGSVDVAPLFVATPELLGRYGVDLATVGSSSDVLTVPTEVLDERLGSEARRMLVSNELYLSNTSDRPEVVARVERLRPSYSSLPGSFITPEAVRQRGWQTVPVGWLVEAASPLTTEQIAAARDLAADAGMLVEPPRREPSLAGLRWGATAAGTLVAIGVLAMTAGLVRTEAAGEVRTLTAVGATRRIRRTLSAATAGGLALVGAALGTAGAYVALVANRLDDIGALASVPVLHLLVILLGIPGIVAAVAWLVAGREPATLARQAIE